MIKMGHAPYIPAPSGAIRLLAVTDVHIENSPSYDALGDAGFPLALADATTFNADLLLMLGDLSESALETLTASARFWSIYNNAGVAVPMLATPGSHDLFEPDPPGGQVDLPTLESAAHWNRTLGGPMTTQLVAQGGTFRVRIIVFDDNYYAVNQAYPDRVNTVHEVGDYIGANVIGGFIHGEPAGGSYRQIPTAQLTWASAVLAADRSSHLIIVAHHHTPGAMTNYSAVRSMLSADGRPNFGLCGHGHSPTTVSVTSPMKYYQLGACNGTGVWNRITITAGSSIPAIELANYPDPAPVGWNPQAPFTIAT